MNARLSPVLLVLLLAGLLLVAIYVRAGGSGVTSVIPWIVLPPLLLFVGVQIARGARRQLGPPTPGTVIQVFGFWTVIVLVYELAMRADEGVFVGGFTARVLLVAAAVTLPYALSPLARRIARPTSRSAPIP